MEQQLPAAPYTGRWAILKPELPRGWRERYTELGVLEWIVPIVFALIFVGVLAAEVL